MSGEVFAIPSPRDASASFLETYIDPSIECSDDAMFVTFPTESLDHRQGGEDVMQVSDFLQPESPELSETKSGRWSGLPDHDPMLPRSFSDGVRASRFFMEDLIPALETVKSDVAGVPPPLPASMSAPPPPPAPLLALDIKGLPDSAAITSPNGRTVLGKVAASEANIRSNVNTVGEMSNMMVKAESRSAAQASSKKRPRRKGPPDQETLDRRRARHNQVEIRRRQRITERFASLRTITACAESDKGSILKAAIEKLEELERQVAALSLQSKDTPATLKNQKPKAALPIKSKPITVVSGPVQFSSTAVHASAVASVIISLDGILVDWNPLFSGMIGRAPPAAQPLSVSKSATKPQSGRALPISDILSPETVPDFFQAVDQLLSGRAVTVADALKRLRRSDNRGLLHVRSMMWLVHDKGTPQYLKVIVVPRDEKECFDSSRGMQNSALPTFASSYMGCNSAAHANTAVGGAAGNSHLIKQEA